MASLTARLTREQHILSPTAQWVVFACSGHRLAIPVQQVCELLAPRPLTRLPGCGEAVCGLISLRGQIITVFDLGAVLGLRPAVALPEHRLLLFEHGERLIAFAVDNVVTTVHLAASQLSIRQEAFLALDLKGPELLGVAATGDEAFLAIDPQPILERLLEGTAGTHAPKPDHEGLTPFRGGNGTKGSDLR